MATEYLVVVLKSDDLSRDEMIEGVREAMKHGPELILLPPECVMVEDAKAGVIAVHAHVVPLEGRGI